MYNYRVQNVSKNYKKYKKNMKGGFTAQFYEQMKASEKMKNEDKSDLYFSYFFMFFAFISLCINIVFHTQIPNKFPILYYLFGLILYLCSYFYFYKKTDSLKLKGLLAAIPFIPILISLIMCINYITGRDTYIKNENLIGIILTSIGLILLLVPIIKLLILYITDPFSR